MRKGILKRVLVCVLSAGMVMSLGGVSALATTGGLEAFAVYCEEDASLTFYTDDVAPAEGEVYDGKTVTTVYENVESLRLTNYREVPWARLATSITDVVFDDSFEKAQPVSLAYWFCYFANASFSGLAHIDTSNVEEMESMFFDCSTAIRLDVSGWDTSKVTDMGVMFSDCYSLERIDGLSDWDTSSVECMDSLFNNCYSLESVDVADWDTSNVTQMGYMFYECDSLTGIDVSNWDTSNVEWMGSMFRDCLSLTALDVSEWNTSSVTDMSNLFYQCVVLSNVDVSGWDTSHVTSMANMFIACPSLTELDVSNWDTSSVWNMSGMFQDCVGLTSLDVSDWDTSNVTSMWALFADCFNLESLDVSAWDTSSVTDMEALFGSCASLTNVDVSNWDTSNVRWMNGTFANCESLTSLDLSGWDTGNVTTYENFATGCDSLKWIKIGDAFILFATSGDALVSQQTWYDSPINGAVVSDDYMIGVSGAGTYYTDTTELTISDVTVTSDLTDNTKVYDGKGVTLTAAVTVDPEDVDLTYQWYKVENGTETPIGSATTDNTLTLTGDVADSGTYKCEVAAIVENVKSDPVFGEITITITEPPAGKTGLYPITPGKEWGYFVNGKVDTSYTGFQTNSNGTWYVENGYIHFDKNSVYKDTKGEIGTKGTWYYVVGNKVQYGFTGLAHYRNQNGWWYIANGVVDFTHNGVDKNQNGWWYVTGGKVQFDFTGLANYKNQYGWWYVNGGKVNFNANTVAKNKNGWWYVTGGKVQFGFTGLAHYKNQYGWWYIKNGKADFTYTGRASNQNGTWNVVNGKVRF